MTGNASLQRAYLSRLLLNPQSRQVRTELAQPYEMHRTLMQAFEGYLADGENRGREKVGMLFRAEVDERDHRVVVYVQSLMEPEWSFLEDFGEYLLDTAEGPTAICKDVSKAYGQLLDRQTLAFRLRANPTKRIGSDAEHGGLLAGKRVGLLREEKQIAWLARKGATAGFELLRAECPHPQEGVQRVPSVTARVEGRQEGRKREGHQLHTMTHLAVLFDGLLRVTNAADFRQTLIRGIGSGKAFGFGLLSIGPASTR
ncbi:MAG: type I-E CRISPR-associated protein Cas6/Cse3/CasE [Candidatus Bipolaricaulis sp.]|nr:type I-E CRISPR-associated protein Cas6/Cse3/CasE [Candidatus Bipolaricaulis sp.]